MDEMAFVSRSALPSTFSLFVAVVAFFSFSLFFYVFLSSERIVLYLPAAPPFIPISAHILHFSLFNRPFHEQQCTDCR